MSAKFLEIAPDQYINMDHVVRATVSITNCPEPSEDGEWRHESSVGTFYSKSKQVIAFKLIDGSIIRSAGIEQVKKAYYGNAWEALNPDLEFDPDDHSIL